MNKGSKRFDIYFRLIRALALQSRLSINGSEFRKFAPSFTQGLFSLDLVCVNNVIHFLNIHDGVGTHYSKEIFEYFWYILIELYEHNTPIKFIPLVEWKISN